MFIFVEDAKQNHPNIWLKKDLLMIIIFYILLYIK